MLVHSWYDDKCCHDKDCRMKILANTVRAPDGAIASPSACAGTALSPSFPRAVSAHHAAGRRKPPQPVFGLREILFFAAAIAAICLVAALVMLAY
jgi:hypothetical protein